MPPLDPELMTVGPTEVVVTFRTDEEESVATHVGDHSIVTSGRYHSARLDGLEPGTRYELTVDGTLPTERLPNAVTTLERPEGDPLLTIATVNDVHFGEVECGRLDGPEGSEPVGPILTAEPGDPPYPELMNRAAIREIEALDPRATIVKGDLTDLGTYEQYQQFLDAYGWLGPHMHHVRGNHDAMLDPTMGLENAPYTVEFDDVTLAILDTTVPGRANGDITAHQIGWLHEIAGPSTKPIFLFGHHHPWDPASANRSDDYFGIVPDASERLVDVIARYESIVGYFAGHTHRNRVRRFPTARDVPIVEVSATKDYPGVWAEYRIHRGGFTQIVHRISDPEAMAWTEKTRAMFFGLYSGYALGRLEDRCFTETY